MLQLMWRALQCQMYCRSPHDAAAWLQPGAEVLCLSACIAALASMLQPECMRFWEWSLPWHRQRVATCHEGCQRGPQCDPAQAGQAGRQPAGQPQEGYAAPHNIQDCL